MNEFTLSDKAIKEIENLRPNFKDRASLILPALWIVKRECGYISKESMKFLGNLLEIPASHINEIATFYAMMNLQKLPKYHIKVCKTLSCALSDNQKIIDHLKNRLGITSIPRHGVAISNDGYFALNLTECLGYCEQAPAMLINETQYFKLDIEKLDVILDELIDKIDKSED